MSPPSIEEREARLRARYERQQAVLREMAEQEQREGRAVLGALERDLPGRFGGERRHANPGRVGELEGALRRSGMVRENEPTPDPGDDLRQARDLLDRAHHQALQRNPSEEDRALRDELRRVADRARQAADELDHSDNPDDRKDD